MSITKKLLIGGVLVIGIGGVVIGAPVALSTVSAVSAVTNCVTATSGSVAIIKKTALAVEVTRHTYSAANYLRQFVYPTEEQELYKLQQRKAQREPLSVCLTRARHGNYG